MSEDKTRNLENARSFEERVIEQLNLINARLGALEENQRQTNERLSGLEENQRQTNQQLSAFGERLSALEDKVERRLHDTRPMWEAVQAQLENLEVKFDRLNDKFDIVVGEFFDMRAEQKLIKKRLLALEEERPH